MTFDHVAVPSNDIAASVDWYRRYFAAQEEPDDRAA